MSAIAKPLIHSTTATGDADPINIEHVAAITKETVFAAENINTSDRFNIIFKFRGENTTPQEITWRYADEATRDASYNAILTLASTLV
jgi:hypothetical protein